MRSFCALIFTLMCLVVSSQEQFDFLDKSDMQTSVLFLNFPVIDIGVYQNNINNYYSFLQAYKAISSHDLKMRLLDFQRFKELIEKEPSNVVKLGVLHSDYEVIKPDAFTNGDINVNDAGYVVKSNNDTSIFDKKTLSIVTPLKTKHKGLQTEFILKEHDVINISQDEITSIKINFNDGNGFVNVRTNTIIPIEYSAQGLKKITTKLTFSNGQIKTSFSKIKIFYSSSDLKNLYNRVIQELPASNNTYTVVPNLSPYGVNNDVGKAEYDIFLSTDGVLDKPIFLIDGFDPGDSRDILGLYDLLNFDDFGETSNLADVLRAQGFDVVILNFPVYLRESDMIEIDGGADFIERNAMLLVELIQIINNIKVGSEQNVIIGPSMGGLISRYALSYMESQNLNHDTRLWISFDAPHLGANVPIGFQYLFNNLAYNLDLGGLGGDQSVIALQPLIDGMLKSPAARQMLVDQFEPHLDTSIITPTAHPYHDLFYAQMNSLSTSGYPELTRNISVINGSGINRRYPDVNGSDILPNREVLNTTIQIEAGITDATFKTRFTPYNSNSNESSFVYIDTVWICFCDLTLTENSESFPYSDGVDAASGGLFNIADLNGDIESDPLIDSFLGALQTDYFNFIPTISSMALEVTNNEIDWFHTPSNIETKGVNNLTPFDNWYMPDNNEPHVTLTQSNVDFTLSEIIQETLTLNESKVHNLFKIEQNPIQKDLVILAKQFTPNVTLRITDVTGKTLLDLKTSLEMRTLLPLTLGSGLYVLRITSGTNSYQTKLIIE